MERDLLMEQKIKTEIIDLKLSCSKMFKKAIIYDIKGLDLICNGVGSSSSWTYHLTPNTIYGLNIESAANIHDWDYTFPLVFKKKWFAQKHKEMADDRFESNVLKLIENGSCLLKWLRKRRLKKYMFILRECGFKAFYADKQIGIDVNRDGGNFEKYKKIYNELLSI